MKRLDEERRRLEEERREFEAYVHDLRRARDKEEFDRFMADRANKTRQRRRDHRPLAGRSSIDLRGGTRVLRRFRFRDSLRKVIPRRIPLVR